MILHIVLYQPKASATSEELAELAKVLETASREIPSIRQVRAGKAVDFGFGYSNWPKDQNTGCVAIFEFDDKMGLESYLCHPAHQALAAMFWKTCEQPTIVDVSGLDPKIGDLSVLLGHITD